MGYVAAEIVECAYCEKKILVERSIPPSDNNKSVIFATCWGCLEEQAKQQCIKKYGIKGDS